MGTFLYALAGATLLLLMTVLAMMMLGAWQHGYSREEMDWNGDGRTTFSEFLASADIGRGEIVLAGQPCLEYFRYKDGVLIRQICQKG